MKVGGKPEPVWVASHSDDLWLEAKYLTSPEIAGSPRNISRYRLFTLTGGVEHCMDVGGKPPIFKQTSNTPAYVRGLSGLGLSLVC